jgi:hypothetical protein
VLTADLPCKDVLLRCSTLKHCMSLLQGNAMVVKIASVMTIYR